MPARTLLLIILMLPFLATAQRISNTALYRNVAAEKYFRLHYENDYFSTSDLYYTQGVNLEFVHPSFLNSFLARLLVRPTPKESKIGIALEQEGYTPSSISHPEILRGDRPFAGCLFLRTFSIVNNPDRMERISSGLSIGLIGPITGAKEIQDALHKLISYKLPNGWRNQIRNDIILNYQVEYEHKLFTSGNHFDLSLKAGARGGTFNTKAYGGFIIMTGNFDDPFKNFSKAKKRYQLYIYAEPLLNLVGYDATLQGGLFNTSNLYTISSGDLSHLVFQGNAGLVFKINSVQLEYFQSFLTKEFETGNSHMWGGIRMGWYLNP